ncbi:MAG: 1-deoxy-D-xylulose-5-phosphate reductoisomerase, partial [Chloroflexi bacterium]|nr:1-deoxy-D-xylulose-5-phosphate reductoisomerase [Chloroflexota bacterium]
SGGAFRDWPQDKLALVAVEEALQHPTWQMGKKVTIDSATLMNKGMEAIEAHWFFDVPLERVEVIMHRESIVHSLVEFVDSSVKAQLSLPDMRLPIQYALSYPERWPNRFQSSLDLSSLCSLSFKPPNWERYPCLRLALEAGRSGGTYPAVLCAADEVAVELFLAGSIRFLDIASIVARVMEEHQGVSHPSLEDVLAADAWARQRALSWGAR